MTSGLYLRFAAASRALVCDGVTLGLPHLVGGHGAMGAIPLPLEPIEQEALERSASILRGAIGALKLT